MTPIEIQTELRAIQKEAGVNAYCSLGVGGYTTKPVGAVLYPYGISHSGDGYLSVEADDFRGAVDALRAAWTKFQDEHKLQSTRKLALAIIRLTAELGECTDAALRAEFDPGLIARWGADACVMANEMAGKGPFSIIAVKNANAA